DSSRLAVGPLSNSAIIAALGNGRTPIHTRSREESMSARNRSERNSELSRRNVLLGGTTLAASAVASAAMAAVCCVPGFVNPAFSKGAPQAAGGSMVLPVPDPAFRGVIGRKASESKPDYPPAVTAPKGAPNVLLIMTDDTGFGAASTFGGPIPTPNLERVYQRGVCYNQFHTTALCSPTRSA